MEKPQNQTGAANCGDDGIGSELLSTMDGDIEEAQRLSELFFQTAREQIEQIRSAVKNRDIDDVVRPAHKCAGSAAACGLTDLADMLRHIEKNSDNMEWAAIEDSCRQIMAEFEDARQKMNNYFKERSSLQ